MRKKINEGDMFFIDQHLSHTAEMLRANTIESIDFAVVEAIAITENGIIPTTSIGNSLAFVENADKVIVEINLAHSEALEGLHDLYSPNKQGERDPIPLTAVADRIGTVGMDIDPEKIDRKSTRLNSSHVAISY